MKTASLGIVALILVTGIGGVIFFNGLGKDKIYDQRELANESFKMRITA